MKIMIVDDEPLIRQRLRETIAWEKVGCSICGESANGLEAVELAYQLKPDIIITDIRMPGLTGLELVERLKPDFHNTKFILLTGFSDFTYAQTAVKLGAFDFVLKPTDEDELLKSVGRAKSALLEERETKAPGETMEKKEATGNSVVREVISYIKNNIAEDISLNSAAQSVYMNPAYLCRLIKKETGKNFTDFVLEYRIEKAKELLKDFHFKTYEIGDKVGFSYSRNFSAKFKQLVGMTPKEYRNSILHEKV